MPYFEKIPGERIYLSPIDPDDLETYVKWLNDIEVTRWLGGFSGMTTLLNERAWIEENTKKTDCYQFAIVLREDDNARGGRLIGGVGLMDLNQLHQKATLGIFIGEAEDRGKGYGAEAIRLLLEYGFRWLGLRNIDLHVHSDNARAIACYKKAGFKECGRRHGVVFTDGQWHDDVQMEALSMSSGKNNSRDTRQTHE
ncbi:MAG: GNAT family N-acetyltransferase [Firmicutes bacterium]|nr:GNAT family N-acetyltransferase [Bacillota bacterium]